MYKYFALLFLFINTANLFAQSSDEIQELREMLAEQSAMIDALQEQLEETRNRLDSLTEDTSTNTQAIEATSDFLVNVANNSDDANRANIGGYGEFHVTDRNGEGDYDYTQWDAHRFVTYLSYDFSDNVSFHSEFEVEHASTDGLASGKDGYARVEQAYISWLEDGYLISGGLLLPPVGIINRTHEPSTFNTVERNPVEKYISPTTWTEIGVSWETYFENGWSMNTMIHSGLRVDTEGSNLLNIRSGRQYGSEARGSNPAFTSSWTFRGYPGVSLTATYQYQSDLSAGALNDPLDAHLIEGHMTYNRDRLGLRALYASWLIGEHDEVDGYEDKQYGWFIEPSYELTDKLTLYTRFDRVFAQRQSDRFDSFGLGIKLVPVQGVSLKLGVSDLNYRHEAFQPRDGVILDFGLGYEFN